LPHYLHYEAGQYRRLNRKTPNRQVATPFGKITLWRHADFRAQRLPIGSGVTEAACKTVFTQRLKLSGMRWSRDGAQVILNLRVSLLSGVWDSVYQALVTSYNEVPPRTLAPSHSKRERQAA
jgi:hypothetical protein